MNGGCKQRGNGEDVFFHPNRMSDHSSSSSSSSSSNARIGRRDLPEFPSADSHGEEVGKKGVTVASCGDVQESTHHELLQQTSVEGKHRHTNSARKFMNTSAGSIPTGNVCTAPCAADNSVKEEGGICTNGLSIIDATGDEESNDNENSRDEISTTDIGSRAQSAHAEQQHLPKTSQKTGAVERQIEEQEPEHQRDDHKVEGVPLTQLPPLPAAARGKDQRSFSCRYSPSVALTAEQVDNTGVKQPGSGSSHRTDRTARNETDIVSGEERDKRTEPRSSDGLDRGPHPEQQIGVKSASEGVLDKQEIGGDVFDQGAIPVVKDGEAIPRGYDVEEMQSADAPSDENMTHKSDSNTGRVGSDGSDHDGHGHDDGEGLDGGEDLPTQLRRLWRGAPPPDKSEGLAVMRDMVESRQQLDGILSRVAATKVVESARSSRGGTLVSKTSAKIHDPFTLAMLADRFAPSVCGLSELRDRGRARMRVISAAGLLVGLSQRVFAREPLPPSDIEAEEEKQARHPQASQPPIGFENLCALVVPAPSPMTAPEMSPEDRKRQLTMREVSALMWCEEDDDHGNDDMGARGGTPQDNRGKAEHTKPRLRFAVQTLDGHVCDDKDEDSDSDDGRSETDGNEMSMTDGHMDSTGGRDTGTAGDRFILSYSEADQESPDADHGNVSRRSRQRHGSKMKRDNWTGAEPDLSESEYQRTAELASVIRRLRAAVRRMDGVLTDEEVRSMARRIVRVSALMACSSQHTTSAAARSALRGLGDRTILKRQDRSERGQRACRWVTIYVGVRRWGRDFYGPGFAVESQDKYRLGWLRMSHATGIMPEATAGNASGPQPRRRARRDWRGVRGFWGLGRQADEEYEEEQDGDVERWVGSLTCNFCEGHALSTRASVWDAPCRIATSAIDPKYEEKPVTRNKTLKQPRQQKEQQEYPDNFTDAKDEEDDPSSRARQTDATHKYETVYDGAAPIEASGCVNVAEGVRVTGSSAEGDQRATETRAASGAEKTEWCTGHVCLRFLPEGVRGEQGRRERGTSDISEASEDDSRAGTEVEDRDSEDTDDVNDDDSIPSLSSTPFSSQRSRKSGEARQKGVPLSSVTKSIFGLSAKGPADSCGVSSEPNSKSLEAFAWGDNTAGCLGLPADTMAALLPTALEPRGLLPGERVAAISCSERHSLLVTTMGSAYASGEGTDGALGLGVRENSDAFRLIEWFAEQMPPPKMCLASAGSDLIGCHSAALDMDGRLYTWGVGAAAGHASLKPAFLPRVLETLGGFGTGPSARDANGRPADMSSRVKGVACGGGFTVAVTNGGKVYSWGSVARGRLGLGSPPVRSSRGKTRVARFQATPRRVAHLGSSPVVQVAAGAWHGMALTHAGEVFTWGYNASGQLGFLVTPSSRESQKLWQQQRREQRFSSSRRASTSESSTAASSMRSSTLSSAASLSDMLRSSWTPVKLTIFGDASTSAMKTRRAPATDEELGPASSGGEGRSSGSVHADHGHQRMSGDSQRHAIYVACGPEHSIVIDSRGTAWTWGAEGRACLGHGEVGYGAPVSGTAAVAAEVQAQFVGSAEAGSDRQKDQQQQQQQQQQRAFVPLSREREVSLARARRALTAGWAVPREVTCLAPSSSSFHFSPSLKQQSSSPTSTSSSPRSVNRTRDEGTGGVRDSERVQEGGTKIVSASAGSTHTVFMTAEGRMSLVGEGAAVAGGDPLALAGQMQGMAGMVEGGGFVMKKHEDSDEKTDALMAISALAGPTPVPREACASWFPAVAARRVAAVACAGQHVVVLLAGDHVGYTLGMDLFRAAMGSQRHLPLSDRHNDESEGGHIGSGEGGGASDGDGFIERWGGTRGVDCELLVAGSYLHAHRVVLARRSPVLRDMIAQEERPGLGGDNDDGSSYYGEGAPLQLLLPDIRFDVARALLEFLYTGELRRALDLDSPLPYDLRAAAKSYGIPRLEALCTEAISLGVGPDSEGITEGAWGSQAVPPTTLASDMGGALGSMEHADVKFVADGKPIYAHRAVLSCQSEYFAAMFRFRTRSNYDALAASAAPSMAKAGNARDTMPEVVVPDSYPGFVRLLLYLYTGVVPESDPEALLEDMVAADRYRLLDMKRICQSMARLSAQHCVQALQTAQMVAAPILRESALFYAEHNLAEVSQQNGFQESLAATPGLAEVLLSRLQATAENAFAIRSAAARQNRLNMRRQQQQQRQMGGRNSIKASHKIDGDDVDDMTFRPDAPFPWEAACVAVVCAAFYHKVSNVVAVGMFVPIINGAFFACLAVFAFHKLKAKHGDTEHTERTRSHQGVSRKGAARGRRQNSANNRSTYLFG